MEQQPSPGEVNSESPARTPSGAKHDSRFPGTPANDTRGSELVLDTCHDVEQLVSAHGTLFLVTNRHGDIAPRGARELGLFYRDTRHLSHLSLSLESATLVHLSAETTHDAFNQVDLMVAGLDEGEFLDDPQNFMHVRRRQLLDGAFIEEITFTNFLGRSVEIDVTISFDVDFADIFEVRGAKRPRRGQKHKPTLFESGVQFVYDGLDGTVYQSDLSISPAPRMLAEDCAKLSLRIAAGSSERIELKLEPGRLEGERTLRSSSPPRPFNARVKHLLEEARAFRDQSTQVRCDNALIQQALDQAVLDLYSLQVDVGGDAIVAAGIPWFCSPFGRDSLIASYQALLLNPQLAVGSLRVLATWQGKRFDELSEEEPGKIFHEFRFGEMAAAGEMPHSPYYGSIDATPLFVILVDATYKVTADAAFLRDMLPNVLAALAFIDARSQNGTRFVTYQRRSARGLDNQGWKDSKAGVSFPDGERADAPIALCEIQGYCVDAYDRGSRILRVLGDVARADAYMARSQALRELINEHFWLHDKERYAYAIDGRGRKLPTVVSNLGHLLWSRVPTPERAQRTAELLLRPESFSGFGVRTLADDQSVYNPLSYHNGTVWPHDNALIAKGMANYRHTHYATAIFEGLVQALSYFNPPRLPELFCGMPRESGNLVRYPVACSPQAWAAGAPFLLLQAILGIHADAPRAQLSIRNASLPPSVQWVSFSGLRVGGARVDLRLKRVEKRVHVDRFDVTGSALRAEIELD